jgi:nucleoside-diphosphate-sugar epimerase
MKKVIITGANGFIGKHLIKYLQNINVEIIAVLREGENINISSFSNIEIIYCNLENIDKLPKLIKNYYDIDVFYHLAWAGTSGKSREDYEMQMKNVIFTANAALVSKQINVKKFISTGTVTENLVSNILESKMKSSNLIYGIAKLTSHFVLDALSQKNGINYVWAQLSNLYGEDNTSGNIVSYTINKLLNNETPAFTKADQPYDLMYINDAIRALYILGALNNSKNSYFIGSGKPRLLKEYLMEIGLIYGDTSKIGIGLNADDGSIYDWSWFDTSAMELEYNFIEKDSFSTNIKKVLDSYKVNKVLI